MEGLGKASGPGIGHVPERELEVRAMISHTTTTNNRVNMISNSQRTIPWLDGDSVGGMGPEGREEGDSPGREEG